MSYPSGGVVSFSLGALTAAMLNVMVDAFNAMFPVGAYLYLLRAATTTETLVNNVWLECNSASVLRATYPDLNTLLSGLSYLFGSVDGTHMTLPDAQGRALISMASGGHTDVNGLGDSDGGAKANRSPKHNHTNSISGSASIGTLAISPSSHTHSLSNVGGYNTSGGTGSSGLASGDRSGASTGSATGSTSLSLTGSPTVSIAGTVGLTGRLTDTGAYLVVGTLFVKAFA